MDAVSTAISAAQADDRPSLICCKTIIGLGAPNKQGTSSAHGAPLGNAEIALARETLGWPHAAFEIPTDILAEWRAVGAHGAVAHQSWQDRHAASQNKTAFDAAIANDFDKDVAAAVLAWKNWLRALPARKPSKPFCQPAQPYLADRPI
jgi:transketolase